MKANSIERCHDIDAVRRLAQTRIPRPIYDYVAAGSGQEQALRRNTAIFDSYCLIPRMGHDVSVIDTKTRVMGVEVSMPLIVAPTGGLGMIAPDAEKSLARAASREGIMFSLSSYSTLPTEEIAESCSGPKMFQLYMLADHGLTSELIHTAKAARFNALAITLDVPRNPPRPRADRWNMRGAGGGIPFRTKLALLRRPSWALRQRKHRGPLTNIARLAADRGIAVGPDFYDRIIRKDVSWADVESVAKAWGGPFAVKGILSSDDARRAADSGATAIIVCNHGGVALDGAPPSLAVIEDISAAVGGNVEVIQSGGLRHGSGIAKSVALGARASMTGRPFIYGIAAAGEIGAARVMRIIREQLEETMALCGCATVESMRQLSIRKFW